MSDKRQQCTRCKVNLLIEKFDIKRCGNTYKQCKDCINKRNEYNKRPEVKEKTNEHQREYRNNPVEREKIREYNNRPDVAERRKIYNNTPEAKAKNKERMEAYCLKHNITEWELWNLIYNFTEKLFFLLFTISFILPLRVNLSYIAYNIISNIADLPI